MTARFACLLSYLHPHVINFLPLHNFSSTSIRKLIELYIWTAFQASKSINKEMTVHLYDWDQELSLIREIFHGFKITTFINKTSSINRSSKTTDRCFDDTIFSIYLHFEDFIIIVFWYQDQFEINKSKVF